ncbi:MAG TPA: glycosyltransferase [Chitinophagaceae bacterium]|nr:glycosyltransferase [Chitinophagaceae bacterium]
MAAGISIITICYNNLQELLQTCASVDMQCQAPFEHWIIDGSSNTQIKDWLEGHPQPAYRKWLSEKDNGIADAFNKGIAQTQGDILNMLNAGDYYFDDTVLQTITGVFQQHPRISWLHGRYRLQRGGLWVIIGKPFDPKKLYRGMRSLSHQSMFIKKVLHQQYGLYDVSLRNAMDYDFVCRISKEPFLFIDKPLVVFAPGGTTDKNYLQALDEGRKVYEKYFGKSMALQCWQLRLRLLHRMLRSGVGPALYKIKVWLKLENA